MKPLFIIVIFLIFVSCHSNRAGKNDASENAHYVTKLKAADKKLTFQLNSWLVNRSVCLQPYTSPDSSNYLFYLSGYTHQLCVFNIDSEKLVNIIKLQPRGPNGVGDANGFEVLSYDSICVTSNFQRRLFIINQEGKRTSTIDYSKYQQDQMVYAPNSRSLENMRMGFKDSKLYIPFYPGFDETNYKSIAPEKVRMVAELDTAAKTARMVDIGLPKDFWTSKFYPPFFGFFIEKDRFYLNFMYYDDVFVSDDAKTWKSYPAKSKYVDVRNGKFKFRQGLNPHYSKLVADPYRDVFYRFAVQEHGVTEERSYRDLLQYPPDFSIMILDKDMNVIGETLFPTDVYDMNGYFITKDGLYLSLSNPYNPNYNVDLLEFQLFKLEKEKV